MFIKKTKWGIANRYDNEIEIHKDLFDRHDLLIPILQHEINHTNATFSLPDAKLDITPTGVKRYELFKFMCSRPGTWLQLFPFWYHPKRKQIVYDLNLIVAWVLVLILTWFWSSLAFAVYHSILR